MNPYDYQKARIGDAVSLLMSLTISSEERVASAMDEFRFAFGHSEPSGEALAYYLRILARNGRPFAVSTLSVLIHDRSSAPHPALTSAEASLSTGVR